MVNVLAIFLQNTKIYHHVVLKVCKNIFSQDSVFRRHYLTFGKTHAITGSRVVHD